MNTKTTVISQEQVNDQLLFCDKISALWVAEGRTPRAYVETYGCQQNEADSERIRGMLAQSGYAIANEAENADVVLAYGPNSSRVVSGALTGGVPVAQTGDFQDRNELVSVLRRIAKPGDVILFKGSHGMHMELALEKFLKDET